MKRIVIELSDADCATLECMAKSAYRDARQQAAWIIAQAAKSWEDEERYTDVRANDVSVLEAPVWAQAPRGDVNTLTHWRREPGGIACGREDAESSTTAVGCVSCLDCSTVHYTYEQAMLQKARERSQ